MDKCIKMTKNVNEVNAMIQALDNTGVRMFMYYPQTKTIVVPHRTCEAYHCKELYENMPYSFAEDYVHEDDYDIFSDMYNKIDQGAKMASATFHSKDLNYCNHVTLTTVSWTDDGKPEDVFGLIEDMSELYKKEQAVKKLEEEIKSNQTDRDVEEARRIVSSSIENQYYALYYIWLENHTYICFREKIHGNLAVIEEKGDYLSTWEAYVSSNLEASAQDKLRKFGDLRTLAQRMGNKKFISCDYYREDVGWTRGQFIAGKRDEKGKLLTVVFTVTDINDEMEIVEKKRLAEIEAMQDPMTKLWNRKAFEQFRKEGDCKNAKTGLMLLDIDRFKLINDQYGHDVGDQVITEVAKVVSGVVRPKDRIFRIGGDEFAVLLYNSSSTVWNAICRKMELIHAELKKKFPSEIDVTISAGLCVNEKGFRDEMFKLADSALYNTKANGRGGCSLINMEGKIVNEWHDRKTYLRKSDVFEKNSTVTWRMEIPKDKDLPVRVYGDELYLKFLGIDDNLSPEETHLVAMSRLEPEYVEIVEEAMKATVVDGQAEAVYHWNHPTKGRVQLRCNSSLDFETDEYYALLGYNHIINDIHVFTLENVNHKIQTALEELFFCNFYIKLRDYSFTIFKAQDYMRALLKDCQNALEAADLYVSRVVAEESREEMREFLDLTTIRQRMKNVNTLGKKFLDSNIGLALAVYTVVDRNEEGEAETVSFVVANMP